MSRSLPKPRIFYAASLAIAACVFPSSARAVDLDALLGDWTANASADASESSVPPTQALVKAQNAALADDYGAAPATLAPVAPAMATPSVAYQANMMSNPYAAPCSSCGDGGCDGGTSCDGPGCRTRPCRTRPSCGVPCGEILDGCAVGHLCLPECRPHHAPKLPPPSTFLQYFRSRNSYSDVWAGYNDETRSRLRNRSPYLVGPQTCQSGCGACAHGACAAGGCATGGCAAIAGEHVPPGGGH